MTLCRLIVRVFIALYYYYSPHNVRTILYCTFIIFYQQSRRPRVMRTNEEKINIYFEKEGFLYDARTCKLDHDN